MRATLGTASHQRDAALVRRHLAGDPTAFGELYELHHQRLLRSVRRQVRQRDLAEDLTHDAFAAALVGIGDLRDPECFYPWLGGIARMLVMRHYRAAGRTPSMASLVPYESDAPDHALLRQVDRDNVLLAMDRVTDRYREVLRLYQHEELSYADIGEQLGVSTAVVKVLMHRARRALRREYLAVTAPDRTAVVLALGAGMAAALRRARDRVVQFGTQLPDGTAVAASMAAAAMGVASLAGSDGGSWGTGATASEITAPGEATPEAASVAQHEGTPTVLVVADAAEAAPGNGGITSVTRYQPDVIFDQEERRRRQSDRHMPYSLQLGPTWWGLDPEQMQRDIESSTEGDFSWMEGS